MTYLELLNAKGQGTLEKGMLLVVSMDAVDGPQQKETSEVVRTSGSTTSEV